MGADGGREEEEEHDRLRGDFKWRREIEGESDLYEMMNQFSSSELFENLSH